MSNKFIKRSVFNDLKEHFDKKEISLIIGPRQAGKTTLMMMLKDYLETSGFKTLFLNFDFEADRKFFISQNTLLEKIKLEIGKERGFVFIDEIQRKENAGLFLKGLYDLDLPYKFIISGSGSIELKEKIHESLAGRKMIFEVSPISFLEFVDFKTSYRYENRLKEYFAVENDNTVGLAEEYMNYGGYPRVILEDTKKEKLRIIDEIYRSYIEKDISAFLRVEKLDVFGSLIKVLAGQIGNILNYSELSNTLNVSLPTIKNYLWYLEKTFVVERVSPFFKNARKELTKSPTVYFYDVGMRNYALGLFGQDGASNDFGFLFQNLIFNILKNKLVFSGAKINFWRTKDKAEVDFVINFGQKIMPIETKYKNLKQPTVERSAKSFIDKYQPKKFLIINKNLKDQIKIGGTKVQFLPFWELYEEDLF